ncbi:PhoX family protein [Yinghuangia sp. ASG 101]|uniref:alkaline phosphatase PhoX n=1 Tax=Yinghuangia sp. ASG 101 TaxID=2896848 RepID=UPI001E37842E|nr:alkaline phosphatase PhoX [Yinghuangia sp. ASG 101]UGQ10473.1 PhoX family protein [Yinghuangia sp. ASG 101]
MASVDRRSFLRRSAAVTGGAVLTTTALTTLGAHAAWADAGRPDADRPGEGGRGGYGPLRRARAANTGEELLALPAGFSYSVFGVTSTVMSDGIATPIAHDGMGAFPGTRRHTVTLIRNHEVRTAPGTATGRVLVPGSARYDELGVSGTTTVEVDVRTGQVVRDFISLNGTVVNCAGGAMYRGAGWITCEETTAGPAQGWARKHGYAFEVPLRGPEPGKPAASQPITAMGRFSHEAVATDPRDGFVYQTEDHSGRPNGFYRYRPRNPRRLADGGVLEMLKIAGRTNEDLRQGQRVGRRLPVEWVRIEDPDPNLENGAKTVAEQGLATGAAKFNRLEGCWYGEGSIYFSSTSGGDVKQPGAAPAADGFVNGYGQVWRYIPGRRHDEGGSLVLVYESQGRKELDSPDNLTFTPRGGIVLCEDDASNDDDTHPLAPGIANVNRLIGLGKDGRPFEFSVNVADDSEFAGACFSPDGDTLFVNTLGSTTSATPPGRTYAIRGPWRRGPL